MAEKNRIPDLVIEGTRLIFRNFAGEQTKFNKRGDRNVGVVLSAEDAERYRADGWNIKTLDPRDEDSDPVYWLNVKVEFDKGMPPKIVMVKGKKKVPIDGETAMLLDSSEIVSCDVAIRPYVWTVNDKSGMAAYMKEMYVVVEEGYFDDKYDF